MSVLDHVIVRPGELALKGNNRGWFEKMLLNNISEVVAGRAAVQRCWGRIYVGPTEQAERLARAVASVFGVVHASAAVRTLSEIGAIGRAARALVEDWLRGRSGEAPVRFRVSVRLAGVRELAALLGSGATPWVRLAMPQQRLFRQDLEANSLNPES